LLAHRYSFLQPGGLESLRKPQRSGKIMKKTMDENNTETSTGEKEVR
jgi:hypothetical protein